MRALWPLALLLAACAAPPAPPAPTAAPPPSPAPAPAAAPPPAPTAAPEAGTGEAAALRLLADEALAAPLTELANAFAALYPEYQLELVLLPAADLAAALASDPPGLAILNEPGFVAAREAGLLNAGEAVPLARDEVSLVVARAGPAGAAADPASALATPGLRLAVDPAIDAGAALASLGLADRAGELLVYNDRAALLNALLAGELDAALLYEGAVDPLLEAELRRLPLRMGNRMSQQYFIAPPGDSTPAALAFADLALSGAGQAAFSAYNFYPPIADELLPDPQP